MSQSDGVRYLRRSSYPFGTLSVGYASSRLPLLMTSISAVAKRPRDASCLSVVSFSSTKRRAGSFIVSYLGYRFITACN